MKRDLIEKLNTIAFRMSCATGQRTLQFMWDQRDSLYGPSEKGQARDWFCAGWARAMGRTVAQAKAQYIWGKE